MPQRVAIAPITAIAPKTPVISGIGSDQAAATTPATTPTTSGISSNQAAATTPATTPALSSAPAMMQAPSTVPKVATVAHEVISPAFFTKLNNVSMATRYEFVDHIPISSRNVQYYRIASYDQGYVESSFSPKVRFTLASYIKPYPPRLVHLQLTDDRQVKLEFAGIPETDFAGFNLYRTDSLNASAPRVKLNASPLAFNAASFIDENPPSGKRSYYLVATVNTEGLESEPSDSIGITVPNAPESLSAQNLQATWNATARGVQLDWQAPRTASGATRTDVIGYVVFRDSVPEGTAATSSDTTWGVAISSMLTTTQFVDTSLTAVGTYTYRVVAFTADEGGLPPAQVTVNLSASP